jgi:hypothetical protein
MMIVAGRRQRRRAMDRQNERQYQEPRTERPKCPRLRDRRRGAGSRGGKIEAGFHLDRVADRQHFGDVLRLIVIVPRRSAA